MKLKNLNEIKNIFQSFFTSFGMDSKKNLQEKIFKEFSAAFYLNHRFPDIINLPRPYGRGLPERVVEILFAKLSYREGAKVLDVGHANSMNAHLKMIQTLPRTRRIIGIDVAKPTFDYRFFYQESIQGDVSTPPFSEFSFNLIWCISTLEHLGMDNSAYIPDSKREKDLDIKVIETLFHLLTEEGELLISVPFGRYENLGTQKNYDYEHWRRLLQTISNDSMIREWFFRHTFKDGWAEVAYEELKYVGYYDQANAGAGGLAVALISKKKTYDSK